jgi:GNAT superfamily N-acetyltransferase
MSLPAGAERTASSSPECDDIIDEFSLRGQSAPVRIRRFRQSDREAIRRICCDTGFLGAPIDAIYQDRELFADLLTGPYLDYEPEWTLVAETEGRVVGYLLGSVSRHFNRRMMSSGFHTARKMLAKLVTGKYADHPRSEQFVRWMLTCGLRERPKHPGNAAHLHFNLDDVFRGRTIGMHIWLAFENMLREAEIPRYYGEFYSHAGRRPEQIYVRYGFVEFDRRETTLFYPEITDTVYVVCACKNLDSPGDRK